MDVLKKERYYMFHGYMCLKEHKLIMYFISR
jgi:hypothetical protein